MKHVLLTISLMLAGFIQAQENNAGAWFYFSLEKDLPDKFTTGVEANVRLNENLSEARTIFLEPWVRKEWTDAFSTILSYRAMKRRNLDNEYENRDRVSIDLKYKFKVKELGIQYRFRTQRVLGLLDEESAQVDKVGMRHRIKLGYDLSKKWETSFSGESFYSVAREGMLRHTDLRLKATLEYKLKKRNYLSFGYLLQREYNTSNPLTEYNLIIGYTLMIK